MTPIFETLLTGILYIPLLLAPFLLLLGSALRVTRQEEMQSPLARAEAQRFTSRPWRKPQTAIRRIQIRKTAPIQKRRRKISAYIH